MKRHKFARNYVRLFEKFLHLSILIVSQTTCCTAQQIAFNDSVQHFSRGIYLENLNIRIPRQMDYSSLSSFGKPKVISKTRRILEFRWDSATILNGIKCSIFGTERKKDLERNIIDFSFLTVLIDIKEVSILNVLFNRTSHYKALAGSNKNDRFTYWYIDYCSVRVGINKSYGGYIVVQKPRLNKKPPSGFL